MPDTTGNTESTKVNVRLVDQLNVDEGSLVEQTNRQTQEIEDEVSCLCMICHMS